MRNYLYKSHREKGVFLPLLSYCAFWAWGLFGFKNSLKFRSFFKMAGNTKFTWFKSSFWFCLVGLCLCFPSVLWANVIRFPEKELASEYVFPVFKNPQAVLNRNVTLRKRVEIKLSGLFRTDEPVYAPLSALGALSFYWNESHGISVSGLFFTPGLNSKGKEMKTNGILDSKNKVGSYFDASLAPSPFLAGFLNYQFSPLYGKISLTKTQVFNFALYTFLGLGTIALKHGSDSLYIIPATNFGIGQKIYFGSYFALDVGIDFLVYRGPNFVSRKLQWKPDSNPPARPAYSSFEKDVFLRFLARAGIVILL